MQISLASILKTLLFLFFLTSEASATNFHSLARRNAWYSLLQELSKLQSREERTAALNSLNQEGKTVLDIVDEIVGAEHSIYIELLGQGAEHGLPETPKALTLKEPTDSEMGLDRILPSFAFGDLSIPTITTSPSRKENQKTLSLEEGKSAIRDKIEIQIDKIDLQVRKTKLESERLRQRVINLLKAQYEANQDTFVTFRLRDGSGYEVVGFYDQEGIPCVYVIYPDLTIGKGGTGGSVFLAQQLTSSLHNDDPILICKKTSNTRNIFKEFRHEAKFARRVGQCMGVVVSDSNLYLFLNYGGITLADLPLDLPNSLRNEIAFKILKVVNSLHQLEIVHGDLKDRNILIRIGIDGLVVVNLCDWGATCYEHKIKEDDKPRDTPQFRLPESGRYSYRSEYWATSICMLMVLEPNYDFDSFQADKPFDAPNLHSDLAEAFPNLLLLNLEMLEHLKKEDPFRFELIQFIQKLTDIDPRNIPTPDEVKLMVEFWEMLYVEKAREVPRPRRKFSVSSKRGIAIPEFKDMLKLSKSSDSSSKSERSPKSSRQPSPKQISPKERLSRESSPKHTNNVSPTPSKPLQRSSPELISSYRNRKNEHKDES